MKRVESAKTAMPGMVRTHELSSRRLRLPSCRQPGKPPGLDLLQTCPEILKLTSCNSSIKWTRISTFKCPAWTTGPPT